MRQFCLILAIRRFVLRCNSSLVLVVAHPHVVVRLLFGQLFRHMSRCTHVHATSVIANPPFFPVHCLHHMANVPESRPHRSSAILFRRSPVRHESGHTLICGLRNHDHHLAVAARQNPFYWLTSVQLRTPVPCEFRVHREFCLPEWPTQGYQFKRIRLQPHTTTSPITLHHAHATAARPSSTTTKRHTHHHDTTTQQQRTNTQSKRHMN